jgi:hypothetical protein
LLNLYQFSSWHVNSILPHAEQIATPHPPKSDVYHSSLQIALQILASNIVQNYMTWVTIDTIWKAICYPTFICSSSLFVTTYHQLILSQFTWYRCNWRLHVNVKYYIYVVQSINTLGNIFQAVLSNLIYNIFFLL